MEVGVGCTQNALMAAKSSPIKHIKTEPGVVTVGAWGGETHADVCSVRRGTDPGGAITITPSLHGSLANY